MTSFDFTTVLICLFIFILFLCFGSFLNVVIYRYPKSMNLISLRSHCPRCKHKLYWIHNIPVISYFFILKTKCHFCHQKISKQYFMVELLTGIVGIILFWRFGFSINPLFITASIFSCILMILIFIDLEHQLLPDIFTLGLLWLGLIVSTWHLFISPQDAIMGAAMGYLSLWLIAKIYWYFTHTEGMGHGDFKLLAALGAWTGWQTLPTLILIASFSGLIISGYKIIKQKAGMRTPFAFGPYLAIAGWIMLLFFI